MIFVRPGTPFLVKIWMTPFMASVPYIVVAAGPFTISMRSIWPMTSSSRRVWSATFWSRSEVMRPARLRPPEPMSTGTPSTKTSGVWSWRKLVAPRTLISVPAPLWPPAKVADTPGTRPRRRSGRLVAPEFSISSSVRTVTALPILRRSVCTSVPVETVTSSGFMVTGSRARAKSTTTTPSSGTTTACSEGLKPMSDARTRWLPGGTFGML